jgi:hypothetical protein
MMDVDTGRLFHGDSAPIVFIFTCTLNCCTETLVLAYQTTWYSNFQRREKLISLHKTDFTLKPVEFEAQKDVPET